MRLVLNILFMLLFTQLAFAETRWVLHKQLSCAEFKTPKANEGDFVVHKCGVKGFPPMWLMYQDSARAKFGFGAKPNFSSGTGSLKQTAGPIEWGGTVVKGQFEPSVVIARLYFDDFSSEPAKPDTTLQIFRLLAGGTSCLVGDVGHVPDQNAKARSIATRSIKAWKCLGEPELFAITQ